MTRQKQGFVRRSVHRILKPPAMAMLLVAGFLMEAMISAPIVAICVLDGWFGTDFDAGRHRRRHADPARIRVPR